MAKLLASIGQILFLMVFGIVGAYILFCNEKDGT